MEFDQFIEKTRKYIRTDRVNEVVELLNKNLVATSERVELKELLSARYFSLEKDKIKGIVSFEELRLEQNKLRESLFSLINLLTVEDIVVKVDKENFDNLYEELKTNIIELDSVSDKLRISNDKYADKIDKIFNAISEFSEEKLNFDNYNSDEQLTIVGFEKMRINMEVASTEIIQGVNYKLSAHNKSVSILGQMMILLELSIEKINESDKLQNRVNLLKGLVERFSKILREEIVSNQFELSYKEAINYLNDVKEKVKSNEKLIRLSSCLNSMMKSIDDLKIKFDLQDKEVERLIEKLSDYSLSIEMTIRLR
jgi:hypothetical protein